MHRTPAHPAAGPAGPVHRRHPGHPAAPTAELLAWDPERGLHRTTGHPLDRLTDHALALVAADAAALLTGPDADKLSACGAGHCSRFLLRTHASRQWCSVRCGDRVRAARAYSRRAGS